jgi:hypothetical protein
LLFEILFSFKNIQEITETWGLTFGKKKKSWGVMEFMPKEK